MITKDKLNEVFGNDVILELAASIKPHEGSLESKTVTLRFNMSGLTVKDVVTGFLADARIKWANGANGRKNYANIKDRSTIDVNPAKPGAKVETPEERKAKAEAYLVSLAKSDPAEFKRILAMLEK